MTQILNTENCWKIIGIWIHAFIVNLLNIRNAYFTKFSCVISILPVHVANKKNLRNSMLDLSICFFFYHSD